MSIIDDNIDDMNELRNIPRISMFKRRMEMLLITIITVKIKIYSSRLISRGVSTRDPNIPKDMPSEMKITVISLFSVRINMPKPKKNPNMAPTSC
jgi:hypothetical protein